MARISPGQPCAIEKLAKHMTIEPKKSCFINVPKN